MSTWDGKGHLQCACVLLIRCQFAMPCNSSLGSLGCLWRIKILSLPPPHHIPDRGLVGNTLDVDKGSWKRLDAGVGAGVDSYYEYLLKVSEVR